MTDRSKCELPQKYPAQCVVYEQWTLRRILWLRTQLDTTSPSPS